jgi:hypothetical protein
LLAWARPVHAATVAIVRPSSLSAGMTEALTRLRGELLSVGLEVTMSERPAARGSAGADSLTWLEQVAAERGASAIIDAIEEDAVVAVDVWVVKTPPRRFEVTRVAFEPGSPNPSERLALRAVEALRGGLLEMDLAARRRRDATGASPSPLTAHAGAASTPPPVRERLGLEAGATALASLDGVGPAVLPLVRVGFALRSWLVVQAALAGAGSRPTVATTGGSVRVAQQFGVLGACYRLGSDRRLWPFFSLAAGALHTSAAGQTGATAEGRTVDQWSLLLDGALGAGFRLHGRYFLTLAAHVQLAEPYVAIHFVDAAVATSGRPNLLLTLTVGAWL